MYGGVGFVCPRARAISVRARAWARGRARVSVCVRVCMGRPCLACVCGHEWAGTVLRVFIPPSLHPTLPSSQTTPPSHPPSLPPSLPHPPSPARSRPPRPAPPRSLARSLARSPSLPLAPFRRSLARSLSPSLPPFPSPLRSPSFLSSSLSVLSLLFSLRPSSILEWEGPSFIHPRVGGRGRGSASSSQGQQHCYFILCYYYYYLVFKLLITRLLVAGRSLLFTHPLFILSGSYSAFIVCLLVVGPPHQVQQLLHPREVAALRRVDGLLTSAHSN